MAIELEKNSQEFKLTDTMHQLVDRLNSYVSTNTTNRKIFDSAVNDLLFMVDRDTSTIRGDSDLTILSNNIDLTIDSDATITATNLTTNTVKSTQLNAGTAIVLSSAFDTANVLLRSNGMTYGALRNQGNNLELMTGVAVGLTLAPANVTVPGQITMPSTGIGSPVTVAKTVSGAIEELKEGYEQLTSSNSDRLDILETDVSTLHTEMDAVTNRSISNRERLNVLEALNISSRLTTLESQILEINTRLDILEL